MCHIRPAKASLSTQGVLSNSENVASNITCQWERPGPPWEWLSIILPNPRKWAKMSAVHGSPTLQNQILSNSILSTLLTQPSNPTTSHASYFLDLTPVHWPDCRCNSRLVGESLCLSIKSKRHLFSLANSCIESQTEYFLFASCDPIEGFLLKKRTQLLVGDLSVFIWSTDCLLDRSLWASSVWLSLRISHGFKDSFHSDVSC